MNLNLCLMVRGWDGLCAHLCTDVCDSALARLVDLTISLIWGEQCFTLGFKGNKQFRAQRLSSLFTTLQLNLISRWDISLITLRVDAVKGKKKKSCLEIVSRIRMK